jgi:hypothetical protein
MSSTVTVRQSILIHLYYLRKVSFDVIESTAMSLITPAIN